MEVGSGPRGKPYHRSAQAELGSRLLLPVRIKAHPAPLVIKSPPPGTPFQLERYTALPLVNMSYPDQGISKNS